MLEIETIGYTYVTIFWIDCCISKIGGLHFMLTLSEHACESHIWQIFEWLILAAEWSGVKNF